MHMHCELIKIKICHESQCPFLQFTRLLDLLRECLRYRHYSFKNVY